MEELSWFVLCADTFDLLLIDSIATRLRMIWKCEYLVG